VVRGTPSGSMQGCQCCVVLFARHCDSPNISAQAMVVSVDGTVISRVVVNVSMEWRDMHKRIGEDAPK